MWKRETGKHQGNKILLSSTKIFWVVEYELEHPGGLLTPDTLETCASRTGTFYGLWKPRILLWRSSLPAQDLYFYWCVHSEGCEGDCWQKYSWCTSEVLCKPNIAQKPKGLSSAAWKAEPGTEWPLSLALDGVEMTMTPNRLIKADPNCLAPVGMLQEKSAPRNLQCWAVIAGSREPK